MNDTLGAPGLVALYREALAARGCDSRTLDSGPASARGLFLLASHLPVNSMPELTDWLERCPLVAILRGVRPDEVEGIGAALVETGFTIIEVPLNSPEPIIGVRRLTDRFGGQVIGAGDLGDLPLPRSPCRPRSAPDRQSGR